VRLPDVTTEAPRLIISGGKAQSGSGFGCPRNAALGSARANWSTPPAEIAADNGTSFDELMADWRKDRKPKAKASVKATELAFAKLRAYLGHGDGSRVTTDEMIDFKLSLGGALNSQRQCIAMMKAVFAVAHRNRKIRPNPCGEIETPPAR